MSLSIHDPDLDDARRPIVVVPERPPGLGAIVAGMAAVLALAAGLWYATGSQVVAAGQAVAGVLLLSSFVGARARRSMPPVLAIFDDGIQFSSDQLVERADDSGPGFHAWDEIGHCRWSSFDPRWLCVCLKDTNDRSGPLSPPDPGPGDPPEAMIFDVPEPYRSEVEAAIRKRGKWAV